MVFFDLNIPFLLEETTNSSKTAPKKARLKLVLKSMELGYSGIAYNRFIKGVMSDSDRCTIRLLPLSSLLKLAPALSTTVQFHRDLLGVPLDAPFRQYTRLTVAVDSAAHAAALNSGNPVLKTYDLVAVRPLNQAAFDQACKVSEVDLIAIDFSQKLPFRIKLPMVKAAIERGVYFEITYSGLICDVHSRRQILQGAKLLVEWTRGKNLIFSSAAPTANELRGPCDVTNLSSLLGLSVERAKAAISKNCRSLITNALRKNKYYKEAIRIERIPDADLSDSKGAWFGDWQSWDPISSGEGDLSLDDIAKFFSAASNGPKTFDATNVASVLEMTPDGTPLKDQHCLISSSVSNFQSPDTRPFFFAEMATGSSATTKKFSKISNGVETFSNPDFIPSNDTQLKGQISEHEAVRPSSKDSATIISKVEEFVMNAACNECPHVSYGLERVPVAVQMPSDDTASGDCISGGEGKVMLPGDIASLSSDAKDIDPFAAYNEDAMVLNNEDTMVLKDCNTGPRAVVTRFDGVRPKPCISSCQGNPLSQVEHMNFVSAANLIDCLEACNEDSRTNWHDAVSVSCDTRMVEALAVTEEPGSKVLVTDACDTPMEGVLLTTKERKPADTVSAASHVSLPEGFGKIESQEYRDDGFLFADGTLSEETSDRVDETEKRRMVSPLHNLIFEQALVETELPKVLVKQKKKASLDKAKAVKGRSKRRLPCLLPFKGVLKPLLFKKRAWRLKR